MDLRAVDFLFVASIVTFAAACSPPMNDNVRVKAANDMPCDQGHVEVEEVDSESAGPNAPVLSPDKKTYVARGCGKTARYVCDFAKASCEKIQ
jgi:hypothetical protein